MIKPLTIPKELPADSALSFDFLRKEGIKHIQQLAGNIWTDHNTHDPGITILEQLCYAITDLSYRIDNNIKDIIGRDDSSSYRDLYSPASILTTSPVTIQDIRKIVIDVKGVKNAWVEKVMDQEFPAPWNNEVSQENLGKSIIKGLYRIEFEKEESADVNTNLTADVRARLRACRSICEDYNEIILLNSQPIRLHGRIEIGQVEDMDQFVANILFRVAAHISPKIPSYSLREMLDMGESIDDIFDGPALNHGFIRNEDLEKGTRKHELHTSDLIREIMDESEVQAVNQFSLSTGSENIEDWVLALDHSKTPNLQLRKSLESLSFVKQGIEVSVDPSRVERLFYDKRNQEQYLKLPENERDIIISETNDQELEQYYSIQNEFPSNYAIGSASLPASAPAHRKAQANQLKGYLMFFDQLLANYFSQIAHFKDLMSYESNDKKTYFRQSLIDVQPELEYLLVNAEGYQNYLKGNGEAKHPDYVRKNKFLNHLLARFSETFTAYAMLLQDPVQRQNQSSAEDLINVKSNFLKNYPELSANRGNGLNYSVDFSLKNNISGLEKRIASKIGIEDFSRVNLGDGDAEGFHMVEHILLRSLPIEDESWKDDLRYWVFTSPIKAFDEVSDSANTLCMISGHGLSTDDVIEIHGSEFYDGVHRVHNVTDNSVEIAIPFQGSTQGRWLFKNSTDPYSLQLTFMLPAWVERYQSQNFKRFIENTIREESPVHVRCHIQWLELEEMKAFDQAYFEFLSALSQQ
ncbi:hypothetical protein [Fulvivirga sediminis]|uniref:Uncharacterized protein n=1 Tax=Fulvivirga sediminis TaxID=2803949 RepID=A0A937F7Q8_9BACT|nr:hypothetical protein [Fulvivirga sediminis]MBL3655533.1 hypothetical protein [Fulvivirga sediminis]